MSDAVPARTTPASGPAASRTVRAAVATVAVVLAAVLITLTDVVSAAAQPPPTPVPPAPTTPALPTPTPAPTSPGPPSRWNPAPLTATSSTPASPSPGVPDSIVPTPAGSPTSDPAMVAAWSSDIHRERAILAAQLTTARAVPARRMSRDEIGQLVDALGGLLAILRAADPGDKLEVYRELGLKLTYNHNDHTVTAETTPGHMLAYCLCPEGDTCAIHRDRPAETVSTCCSVAADYSGLGSDVQPRLNAVMSSPVYLSGSRRLGHREQRRSRGCGMASG